MLLKKVIFSLTICLGLMSTFVPVCASEIQPTSVSTANESIQRNDVYIYKYMTLDGIKYRRLWNATKGEWAEPYWTPCP